MLILSISELVGWCIVTCGQLLCNSYCIPNKVGTACITCVKMLIQSGKLIFQYLVQNHNIIIVLCRAPTLTFNRKADMKGNMI